MLSILKWIVDFRTNCQPITAIEALSTPHSFSYIPILQIISQFKFFQTGKQQQEICKNLRVTLRHFGFSSSSVVSSKGNSSLLDPKLNAGRGNFGLYDSY